MSALLVTVHLHDGRYHGRPEWPPSPARLFQALVSGAAQSASLDDTDARALEWLEKIEAPIIAVPAKRDGQRFKNYVPNNDLDAVGSDPSRIGGIRTPKLVHSALFDAETPFLFLWNFAKSDESARCAKQICTMSERLYQFGRGVDMAWAYGEMLNDAEGEARLIGYGGVVHRPSRLGDGAPLPVPLTGSLKSLVERHKAERERFRTIGPARTAQTLFSQPPKPRFRTVAYDSPPKRLLFDLVGPQAPWRLAGIAELTQQVRDSVLARLAASLSDREAEIERVIKGRPDSTEIDKKTRVRITPLPSIGHPYADQAIRRVLIEVPPDCPLRADDLEWAFSGLEVVPARIDAETGEVLEQLFLVSAQDRSTLRHYGMGGGDSATHFHLWRTVTPAALPFARRRIDPAKLNRERKAATSSGRILPQVTDCAAKPGHERSDENAQAAGRVIQALRHAGIAALPSVVRVQREPFDTKGGRAEAFAPGTRFSKERLWHVEIAFSTPVRGPLVVGDGRYAGLGLMEPVQQVEGIHSFAVSDGMTKVADELTVSSALRRAVMARVQETIGARNRLNAFFTGHELNGTPARRGAHVHLTFVADLVRDRLLVIAPHVVENRSPSGEERGYLRTLDRALDGLSVLRAGAAGKLKLRPTSIDLTSDPLFAPVRHWESVTDYRPTRHTKRVTPAEALIADLQLEIRRGGKSTPEHIAVLDITEGTRGGLSGRLQVTFATAIKGPLVLGWTRHLGGGLFSGKI